jgi:hypothetical protein
MLILINQLTTVTKLSLLSTCVKLLFLKSYLKIGCFIDSIFSISSSFNSEQHLILTSNPPIYIYLENNYKAIICIEQALETVFKVSLPAPLITTSLSLSPTFKFKIREPLPLPTPYPYVLLYI